MLTWRSVLESALAATTLDPLVPGHSRRHCVATRPSPIYGTLTTLTTLRVSLNFSTTCQRWTNVGTSKRCANNVRTLQRYTVVHLWCVCVFHWVRMLNVQDSALWNFTARGGCHGGGAGAQHSTHDFIHGGQHAHAVCHPCRAPGMERPQSGPAFGLISLCKKSTYAVYPTPVENQVAGVECVNRNSMITLERSFWQSIYTSEVILQMYTHVTCCSVCAGHISEYTSPSVLLYINIYISPEAHSAKIYGWLTFQDPEVFWNRIHPKRRLII